MFYNLHKRPSFKRKCLSQRRTIGEGNQLVEKHLRSGIWGVITLRYVFRFVCPRYSSTGQLDLTRVQSIFPRLVFRCEWSMDPDWLADLQRVGGTRRAFLREQSLWAIWVYRFGRRVDCQPNGLRKRCLLVWYWFLNRVVETLTGIGLPKAAKIGPGLRIWHFGGIFIHPNVVMGRDCTLRQGVTVGDKGDGGAAPLIGDHVDFGSCAHVIGPVKVGSYVKVGAMTLVLHDVADYCTVVGNPGRVIQTRDSTKSSNTGS